jgi:hypothetical protein
MVSAFQNVNRPEAFMVKARSDSRELGLVDAAGTSPARLAPEPPGQVRGGRKLGPGSNLESQRASFNRPVEVCVFLSDSVQNILRGAVHVPGRTFERVLFQPLG